MKKENKNENIWTREFNPSVDIVYYIDIIIKYIKIIAKYIYDKILTRWGIFLISLVGFGYVCIDWYIFIYLGSYYPEPKIRDQWFHLKEIVCIGNSECINIVTDGWWLFLIFIPIFLYSTIFLFYKNKEKFEKWRLFTLWYLFVYILLGIPGLKDTGGIAGELGIIVFLTVSLTIYLLISSWIISKKLGIFMTFLIVSISTIIYWEVNAQELPPTEENIILNINSTSTPNISRIKYNSISTEKSTNTNNISPNLTSYISNCSWNANLSSRTQGNNITLNWNSAPSTCNKNGVNYSLRKYAICYDYTPYNTPESCYSATTEINSPANSYTYTNLSDGTYKFAVYAEYFTSGGSYIGDSTTNWIIDITISSRLSTPSVSVSNTSASSTQLSIYNSGTGFNRVSLNCNNIQYNDAVYNSVINSGTLTVNGLSPNTYHSCYLNISNSNISNSTSYNSNTFSFTTLPVISKSASWISITSPSSYNYSYYSTFTPQYNSNRSGTVTYTSQTTNICYANNSQYITILSTGQCIIYATIAEDNNYYAANSSLYYIQIALPPRSNSTLSINNQSYTFSNNSAIYPSINRSGSNGAILYNSNSPSVCSANNSSFITMLSPGICNITALLNGDNNYNSAIANGTLTFNIPYSSPSSPSPAVNNNISNIMFIPGVLGSKLFEDGVQRWPAYLDYNQNRLIMDSNGNSVYALKVKANFKDGSGITEEVPNGTINIYKSLVADLNEIKNNRSINDFSIIPYDWRLSTSDIVKRGATTSDGYISFTGAENIQTSYIIRELEKLANNSQTGKVTIIAHSYGGLVTKELLKTLESNNTILFNKIDKIIFVAVPQYGTPDAIVSLLHGKHIGKWIGYMKPNVLRKISNNMPSAYNLIPTSNYFPYLLYSNEYPFIDFNLKALGLSEPFSSKAEIEAFYNFAKENDIFINRYGNNIDTYQELKDYLIGSEGRPAIDDNIRDLDNNLKSPQVLNNTLLQNAINTHQRLSNTNLPTNAKLYQIAGWGIPTYAGIEYTRTYKCANYNLFTRKCESAKLEEIKINPKNLLNGDETVLTGTAQAMSGDNVKNYWVDMNKTGYDHSYILEIPTLRSFLKNLIRNNESTEQYISNREPSVPDDVKFTTYGVHSPSYITAIDDAGNITGYSTSTGEYLENIPGSYYREIGEDKSIIIPEGVNYKMIFTGYASGSVSIERGISSGDTITQNSIIQDIQFGTNTIAQLTDNNSINMSIPLTIDNDGNGTIDRTLLLLAENINTTGNISVNNNGSNTTFSISASAATGTINYEWQYSSDNENWAPANISYTGDNESATNTVRDLFDYQSAQGTITPWVIINNNIATATISYYKPRVLTKYELLSNANSSYMPDYFRVDGSNDNVTWTQIDEQSNQTNWAQSNNNGIYETGEKNVYSLSNNIAYKYYRFNFKNSNNNTISIGSIHLYEGNDIIQSQITPNTNTITISSTDIGIPYYRVAMTVLSSDQLSQNTYYSNSVTLTSIATSPIFLTNLIATTTTYIQNSSSSDLVIDVVGLPTPVIRWQESNNGNNWNYISGQSSTFYKPPTNIIGTKYYRGIISNQAGDNISNITQVTITAPATSIISGNIYHYSSTSKSISGAIISLTNRDTNTLVSTTTTNNTGNYTFNNVTSGGNYSISVLYTGASSTTGININDNIRNAQIIVGIYTPTDNDKISADTNQDGTIDIGDNIRNAQIIVGTYSLPIPFMFIPTDNTDPYATSTENSITKKNYLWPSYQSKSITNLQSDTTINFKGYKVGDSNGDWR